MQTTLSLIQADVCSIGGHTKPSDSMLEGVRSRVREKTGNLLIDGIVTYTGDDIAIIMSHRHGTGATEVHRFAWNCFLAASQEASRQGLYGAGQDLLVDAPSGNVRGAGPAVAEIEFVRDPKSKDRPAEAFLVFAADKCSPGAYTFPLYTVFCDPMHNGGLLLSPKIHQGFTLTIIDMDHKAKDSDRVIRLPVPERAWDLACLLQNPDRFAIEAIHSRYKPDEQIVSAIALAALRGVSVEIVMPEHSDHAPIDWASRAQLGLLAPDIRAYLAPQPFSHAKLMTVDGAWCLIGTANWDVRSMRLNFEFNLECYTEALTAQVDRIIDSRIEAARRISSEALAKRPLPYRLRDASARLLLPYL